MNDDVPQTTDLLPGWCGKNPSGSLILQTAAQSETGAQKRIVAASGFKDWDACKAAGWLLVPVFIREVSDAR